jgi:hypothetical protein
MLDVAVAAGCFLELNPSYMQGRRKLVNLPRPGTYLN